MCSFAANVFEALPILCILEFEDHSLSPIAATSHGRTSLVSEINWMHLDHLQAALGRELLQTHNDLQQAALASAAEEQASRDGKRNAFDIILQGVVQVSQGRNLVSLFVQLLPGFYQLMPASSWLSNSIGDLAASIFPRVHCIVLYTHRTSNGTS